MKTRRLGGSGLESSNIGLGCMGMSEFYGPTDEREAWQTLQRAMELGVTMLDTADLYGNGDNERLIGRFMRESGSKPLIATKCGIVREKEILPDGNFRRSFNGRPDYIRRCCEASLQRLGVDVIDLFYLHRIDPLTPLEDSVGVLGELVLEGKVRAIGLSEASAEQIHRAHAVHPLAAVQSEYSLWTRDVEASVLPACRELGITLVAYSPLGRGMLPVQRGQHTGLAPGDFRSTLPRFQQENLQNNAELFECLEVLAKRHGITPARLSLAWLLAQGSDIVPIPGTRHVKYIEDNCLSGELTLPCSTLADLNCTFAHGRVAGARYTPASPPKLEAASARTG
jgi:aryl-alcohol dehydrogenase-like predicted oxidoreductase